jgi:hypothetical protein
MNLTNAPGRLGLSGALRRCRCPLSPLPFPLKSASRDTAVTVAAGAVVSLKLLRSSPRAIVRRRATVVNTAPAAVVWRWAVRQWRCAAAVIGPRYAGVTGPRNPYCYCCCAPASLANTASSLAAARTLLSVAAAVSGGETSVAAKALALLRKGLPLPQSLLLLAGACCAP